MQKRSMEKQRKIQALVSMGKSKPDVKTNLPVSKTQSTLLSQDKNKSDVKSIGLAFGSAMGGVAGAVIGSIAAVTSTSGQPFPTAQTGDSKRSSRNSINIIVEEEFKMPEHNSDEQDRSSSVGFDSDFDEMQVNELKPTASKKRKKDRKKRSPSSGIQIPIPRLESPDDKSFVNLILPTPNLIINSSSTIATLHYSSDYEKSEIGQESLAITSPKTETIPVKRERPSVSKYELDNCSCEDKNNIKGKYSLEEENSLKEISIATTDMKKKSPTKDIIVETKSGEIISRVCEVSELIPASEVIDTNPSSSDIKSRQTLVSALSKKIPKRKKKQSRKGRHKSKSENRARKALRTISFILGAFVVCWTPYHICALVAGFCRDATGCVNHHLFYFTYFLCYANSPINPFCYAMANQQFKKTFTRILKGDFHKT